jgi:hypothetical protein
VSSTPRIVTGERCAGGVKPVSRPSAGRLRQSVVRGASRWFADGAREKRARGRVARSGATRGWGGPRCGAVAVAVRCCRGRGSSRSRASNRSVAVAVCGCGAVADVVAVCSRCGVAVAVCGRCGVAVAVCGRCGVAVAGPVAGTVRDPIQPQYNSGESLTRYEIIQA